MLSAAGLKIWTSTSLTFDEGILISACPDGGSWKSGNSIANIDGGVSDCAGNAGSKASAKSVARRARKIILALLVLLTRRTRNERITVYSSSSSSLQEA